jgi:hypothetical protein
LGVSLEEITSRPSLELREDACPQATAPHVFIQAFGDYLVR